MSLGFYGETSPPKVKKQARIRLYFQDSCLGFHANCHILLVAIQTNFCAGFYPVRNCNERDEVDFASSGTRTLRTDFFNPSSPRDVGASFPTPEHLLISGLEEFVGYVFNVTIATSAGGTVSTEDCQMTFPASK